MPHMEFKDIVMQRYATKKFDRRKIDQALVDQLFEMIRFAPSALNLQPWKIRVVTDQKTKEQLKPASWDQEQITTCSHRNEEDNGSRRPGPDGHAVCRGTDGEYEP